MKDMDMSLLILAAVLAALSVLAIALGIVHML